MRTAVWIVVVTVGLFLVFRLWSVAAYYRGLFSVDHYREVAQVLENLRSQAVFRPLVGEEVMDWGEDPRTAFTSRNLALAYTIRQEEGLFIHHLSVTTPPRGGITFAAGETFVSFFAWRLGLKPAECSAFMGVSVFHLEFTISEQNQKAFMERSLSLPSGIDLETIRGEVLRVREQIEFFDGTALIEADLAQAKTADP